MLSRVSIDIFSFLLNAFIVKSPKSLSNTPGNTSSRVSLVLARGGHSNRLCINTRDRVKNGVKQSKPKIWKVKRSKAHFKLEKSQGSSTVKGQLDTKSQQSTIAHQSKDYLSGGQGPKYKVKNFDRRRRR